MRFSSRRQLILETLMTCSDHPTAEDLYERVRVSMPSISLGTVYRNLNLLVDTGVIRKFEPPGQMKARYDAKREEHTHLVCRECDTVYDVDLPTVREFDREVKKRTGFLTEQHEIVLKGVCSSCTEEITS